MENIIDKVDDDSADEFDRHEFACRVSSLLFDRSLQKATGAVVGITGPWGSGKSKAIRMVLKHLEDSLDPVKPVILITFNPWLVSGHETLVGQFYELLWENISLLSKRIPRESGLKKEIESLGENLSQIRRRIRPWLSLTAKSASEVNIFGVPVGKILGPGIEELASSSSLEKEKDKLAEKIKKTPISAIVLIDEIDRLSDEDVRQMAKVIKSLADFKEFSYLLAYDPDRVAKALGGTDIKLGHQYLEKIVQVQLRLPRALPARLREYVRSKMKPIFLNNYIKTEEAEAIWSNHEMTFREVVESLVPEVISTPRDALRLLAAFEARLPMVEEEVDLVDLVRYCALESQVPFLSERLQNLVRRVTVDGRRELARLPSDMKPESETIKLILGEYTEDQHLRNLLLLLFPALGPHGHEVVAKNDTSLSYETPLSTLLNCRKHPQTVSVSDAMIALRNPLQEMEALLSAAFKHDVPRHAILRLRSVASKTRLKQDEVTNSWECMGRFFDRDLSAESMGHYSSWLDLTHVWVRGALRNYTPQHPISNEFVSSLIHRNYIHLPARIIYFHLQAYGIQSIPKDSSLRPFISKDETEELLETAAGVVARGIEDLLKTNRWVLKSIVPLWIIHSGIPNAWEKLKDTLSAPATVETSC
jgi:energy-coupling factor transporter ATP-binding protein EcfA2